MPRGKSAKSDKSDKQPNETYWEKVNSDVSSNQSKLSMVLGGLIILVVGVLVFNYFNKQKDNLGPAQQTQQQEGDVSPQNLPGKYTVKEGDTLFLIADKYYQDGYKFTEIVKANNLSNENVIEVGQVLDIPKLEAAASISPTAMATTEPTATPSMEQTPQAAAPGSKGASDATMMQPDWGPKITESTYTVVAGDWLSKIAGRAYGDIFAFDKIAKANNIANPNLIEPGMVLTIPR